VRQAVWVRIRDKGVGRLTAGVNASRAIRGTANPTGREQL